MRRAVARPNASASSLPSQSSADFTMNIAERTIQQGQVVVERRGTLRVQNFFTGRVVLYIRIRTSLPRQEDAMNQIVVNEPNKWRLETPGSVGWRPSPRPGAARKNFMMSDDCHANGEPLGRAHEMGGDEQARRRPALIPSYHAVIDWAC